MGVLFGLLLAVMSIFLILLVLVQKGKGGGLTGALGGTGGQSAFGAKAGDVMTRVTVGAAFVWIVLCLLSVKLLGGAGGSGRLNLQTKSATQAPVEEGMGAATPATTAPAETPAPEAPPAQ
jgi:preprotein translocase subunit SecG